MSIEGYAKKILENLNTPSFKLLELVDVLPTTLVTDEYINEANKHYEEGKFRHAFHYLSLAHSTLLYHKLLQKLHRPKSSKSGNMKTSSEIKDPDLGKCNGELPNAIILRPTCPEETMDLLKQLPSDWTVVQVTCENKTMEGDRHWKKINEPLLMPTLYISRCKCGPSPSVIIKKIYPPKGGDSVRSILQEMELIKSENKVISKNYSNDHEKYVSKREELNNRLRALVRSMEIAWLHHWSCLFVGALPPCEENAVIDAVKEAAKKCDLSLSNEQLSCLVLIVTTPSLAAKSYNSSSLPNEIPLRAGVAACLNVSVRSEVVKKFAALINSSQRLISKAKSSHRGPIILVLDKPVVTLPWEMIQTLREQPVTRMPSFQSLVFLYLHHARKEDSVLVRGVDINNGFFILDPENNLPRTKERLKDCFAATKWSGITGEKPSTDQFKDALTSKDIVVYVGHGSGSQYMPSHLVESTDCHPLVLLYGCSSTSLTTRGTIPDPWGAVLNYLIASCPCVVGMLWDVMDKDTDLLTREMIKAMRGIPGPPRSPLEDPPTDIALLVSKARPLCSWYLISAALSVYGLPLQMCPQ